MGRKRFIRPFGLLNASMGFNSGYLGLGRTSTLVCDAPQAHVVICSI
jgi:hypothetical protein